MESGIRSSGRIKAQANANDTQLQRAMLRAQQRDSPFSGLYTTPKFSILNFSEHTIKHRARVLGVSLGESPSKVDASVTILKETESDRYLTVLKNNASIVENDPQNLYVSKVSALCEDLTEEDEMDLNDHTDRSIHDVQAPCGRRKKVYDKTKVRRSSRIKKIQRKSK
jgi:hypothetical protein